MEKPNFNLDEMIMDVEATPVEGDKIRLKYLAISGGCGPALTMDKALAKSTIAVLSKAMKEPETLQETS